jgi:phospholipid transport system substrate-binding protein
MLRRLLITVLIASFAFAAEAPRAHADDMSLTAVDRQQGKLAFARDFAQKVLAIIQDPKKNYADRKDVLRRAFANSVDIDWIARFVIGAKWNSATPEQKEIYMALYRKFLTETYVSNFAENPDKRIRDIKIFGVKESNDTDFTVRTEMQLANMENVKVNYLVSEKEGRYKVRDIAIENVSLITTHRSQFTNLASSRGIEGVISKLKQLIGENKAVIISMQ